MKNKKIIVITLLSIIIGLVILNLAKTKDIGVEKTQKRINTTNMLTMMLETEAGTGNYEEVKQSEWPQDGYVFNKTLSKCENGSELSWDDINKKVVMESNTSDKCYVYFDVKKESFADYIINNIYTEDGANGLYYHDGVGTYTNASEEAGDNSYRYSGADPNNYVCFGSDAAICPDDNLYRIIGLFDDDLDGNYQIKLIKNSSIGSYAWDNSSSNDWTTASLNNSLNNDLFWNTLSSEWQNMVSLITWHLGAMDDINYTAKEFYNGENNNAGYGANPTTYTDEIGLMYVSDYGYAASPANWTTYLRDYNDITNNNWLYLGDDEWTTTPTTAYTSSVYNIGHSGYLTDTYVDFDYQIRPVFYLNTNVGISDGIGTSVNPYRLVNV